MSIIHDALKRAQKDLLRKKDKDKPRADYNKLKESGQKYHASEGSQPSQETQVHSAEHKSWSIPHIVLICIFSLFIGVFITFLVVILNQTFNERKAKEKSTPKVSSETAAKIQKATPRQPKEGELILSGTMTMGEKRVALINNEIYELGESINGQKIIKIELKSVTLEDVNGKKIKLDVRKK